MEMVRNDQVQKAAEFISQNKEVVERVREVLMDAARACFSMLSQVLPEKEKETAVMCLERKDVLIFVTTIRPHAAPAISKFGSGDMFWDLVDGCNFYCDGTLPNWPYMTNDRRMQSLVWAEEHAKTLLSKFAKNS